MPAGFGFSVGDFVAAINLVRTVIDALKRTGGAKDDFTELIRQLYSLEKALIRVNDVELDDSQLEDAVALQHAASQCRLTIDEFLVRVSKYQPHLGQIKAGPAYLARAKAAWMAIRWAICEEKDVAKFRADLNAHVTSIELLLLAVQMNKASIDASCEKGNNKSLITQLRDTSNLVLQKFSRIGQQIKDLQGMASQVVHMNLNIFHTVLHIQRLLSRIPPSIERQQPVLLTDPFGRISPFHLEFVRSSECFLAILRVHFQKAGVSSTKLEKREFFIQDVSTRLEVNLHDEWEACFQPGQHVVMSVVFDSLKSRDTNSCPHCQAKCVSRDNEDVECGTCRLNFHRIVELPDDNHLFNAYRAPTPLELSMSKGTSSVRLPLSLLRREKCESDATDNEQELKKFRRVRFRPLQTRRYNCELWALWDRKAGVKTLQAVCTARVRDVQGEPYLEVQENRPDAWTLMYESLFNIDCQIFRMDDERLVFDGKLKYPMYVQCDPPKAHALCFESGEACTAIWSMIPIEKRISERSIRRLAVLLDWNFPNHFSESLLTLDALFDLGLHWEKTSNT